MQLESGLGLGTLLQAYRLIQALYEGEGEGPEERGFPVEQLAAVVGEDNTHHCPALIGLVLADSAYSDTNTEGKGQVQSKLVVSGCIMHMCEGVRHCGTLAGWLRDKAVDLQT